MRDRKNDAQYYSDETLKMLDDIRRNKWFKMSRNPEQMKELDERLKEEAIARAKAQENQPNVIFVKECQPYFDEHKYPYGDDIIRQDPNPDFFSERAYIKDEKGDYQPTRMRDWYFFQRGFNSKIVFARNEFKKLGSMVVGPHAIYHRNSENEGFKTMEKNPNCTYEIQDNGNYWRSGAADGVNYKRTLVSQNPVTGQFEDVDYKVFKSYRNFLIGQERDKDGELKTTIYKRNSENGKFELDAKFPCGELEGQDWKSEYSIFLMFNSNETYYTYGADNNYSKLVRGYGDEQVEIDRFSNEIITKNKSHKQKPFENLAELMKAKDKGGNGK